MSTNHLCPHCKIGVLELMGVTECDDDESLSLFCDEWRCLVCGETVLGAIADDYEDDDDYEEDEPADFSAGWEV